MKRKTTIMISLLIAAVFTLGATGCTEVDSQTYKSLTGTTTTTVSVEAIYSSEGTISINCTSDAIEANDSIRIADGKYYNSYKEGWTSCRV